MRNITPYLHFNGTAEEAMNYYKSILGGTFTIFQQYKDVPGAEKMPLEDQERFKPMPPNPSEYGLPGFERVDSCSYRHCVPSMGISLQCFDFQRLLNCIR